MFLHECIKERTIQYKVGTRGSGRVGKCLKGTIDASIDAVV